MKNTVVVWAIAVLVATCVIISNGNPGCQDSIDWAKKVADPLSDFTVQLYTTISNKQPQQNIVFSPVSMSLALALLKEGADGDTRWQMRYVLLKRGSNDSDTNNIYQALQRHLNTESQSEDSARLRVVNGFYHQEQISLKQDYSTLAQHCYGVSIGKCDFRNDADGCRNRINEWVANSTAQKIPQLFREGAISRDTVAALANAVHFKAAWYEAFPSALISTSAFYRFGKENDAQSVQYLSNSDQYLYSQTSTVSIVGVPYKGNDFYMYIVLPKKRDGLEDMERTFTGTELMFLINRTTIREVEVKIPKFKVNTRVDLKPILTSLGLKDMFNKAAANFSRMTESPLFVDAAAHEAFIHVNENGTEAAAATGLAIRPMSARPIPIPFVADHPFFYAIVHQPTRAIIFAGKVLYIDQ